jgi:hypothetical protein
MAGEWFPVDVALDTKPEVQELVDLTGEPVEVIVFRLFKLWGWAQLNSSDGTFRATPARLGRICGGTESFWLAVAKVGWIAFAEETAQIPKWVDRFSGAAKARTLKNRRQSRYRGAHVDGDVDAGAPRERLPQDITGQDITEEDIQAAPVATSDPPKRRKRSQPHDAVSWSADAGWKGITDADRSEWSKAFPGAVLDQELAKATAWLHAHPERAGKRKWRAFIVRWLSKCQDSGGTNRTPRNRPDEKPPPKVWKDQYQAAPYRRPREVVALAEGLKLKDEENL